MTTKIQKWGNSLAVRIPKSFASTTNIEDGMEVKLEVKNGKIIISRKRENVYKLSEMLSKVSDSNLHKEYEYGNKAGKEIL